MDAHKVATGFAHLLMSQVASRAVTFGLNLLVARRLTPDAYGVGGAGLTAVSLPLLSSIQLHLLITTIMMLSREGFRRGCLRLKPQDGSSKVEAWRVLRVAWLVLPVGALVSTLVCGVTLHRHQLGPEHHAVPGYSTSIILHGVAAMVELASEPFYILASINMQYRQRLVMDSAPLAAKSLLTLACVAGWLGPTAQAIPAALVFAYSQLAFAAVTLLGYFAAIGLPLLVASQSETAGKSAGSAKAAGSHKAQTVAGQQAGWRWTSEERHVLASTAVFSMQSAVKLVLAEGSKLVLSQISSGTAQGVVGLVSNLGSLVVRTLFQPLEEVAFTAFSRQNAVSRESQALRQQLLVLRIMVKAVSLLGLLAVVFGPPNAWLAIELVYGQTWAATEAPTVLSVYCVYILLLAINGVTEAFVHAVLDNKSLAGSNLLLLAPTAAHLLACVLLIKQLGGVGFVAADAANMAVRIAISLWYIQRHFHALQGFSASQLLVPGRLALLLVMTIAHLALHTSKALLLPQDAKSGLPLKPVALHLLVNIVALAAVLLAVLQSERETISAIRALSRKEHSVTGREVQHEAKEGEPTGSKKEQ